MPAHGRDDRRLEHLQTQALKHPLRLRILELHERDRGRSLTVESLTADLASTPDFEGVPAAKVKYHRDRLRVADLLPA